MRSNNQQRGESRSNRDRDEQSHGSDRANDGRRGGRGERYDETNTGNWGSSDSDGQYDDENGASRGGRMDLAQDEDRENERDFSGLRGHGEDRWGYSHRGESDRGRSDRHVGDRDSDRNDRSHGDGGSRNGGYRSSSYGDGGDGYGMRSHQGNRSGGQRWGSEATRGEHTGKGPKGYRRSDERIQEDVNEALSQHGGVDASDVEVGVTDGDVTLSGSVADRDMKRKAEECVENCSGVNNVQNNLRVGGADKQQQESGAMKRESGTASDGSSPASSKHSSKRH
ncbi:MAG TPA: BON domain-containing protein [Gemmatimonadales bacterium]|jgi:hypothetical protein|nr:BON domain-containing protein [Gemmatimonadales bacterium]